MTSLSPVDDVVESRFPIENGADPLATIALLWQGYGDPQMRFANGGVLRATQTADGPASLHIRVTASRAPFP